MPNELPSENQTNAEAIIETHLDPERPEMRITRAFLAEAACSGALYVKPDDYRKIRQTASEIAEESQLQ